MAPGQASAQLVLYQSIWFFFGGAGGGEKLGSSTKPEKGRSVVPQTARTGLVGNGPMRFLGGLNSGPTRAPLVDGCWIKEGLE